MWIAILVILVGGLYLVWCLMNGRIVATLGTDLHKKTSLVDRNSNPTTFWIAWVASAGALILFAAFIIRVALQESFSRTPLTFPHSKARRAEALTLLEAALPTDHPDLVRTRGLLDAARSGSGR